MSDNFSEYLIDTINKGALSLMLSIGHRSKLFDLMSTLPSSSIKEIAEKSKLNERYVREWLGAMVTGKIITGSVHLRKGYSLRMLCLNYG